MYNILISGGAGFIGKNLIKNLVLNNTEIEIIVLDNFITSDPDYFDKFKSNLLKINPEIKITLFDFNITNNKLISFLKERYTNINEIYHLASLASPIYYKKYPLLTLDCGYIGTKNMLDIAYFYNSKFLLASTSEIYGDSKISPQPESYYGNVNSFGERSCYDESKRIAESLVFTYQQQFNLNARIARIFNTYGPEMLINDGRIITEIIKHLINDTELTIFGDGNQTRSICYINDTVNMLINLMKSDYQKPINIGNDIEMSVNKIVDLTLNIFKENVDVNKKLNIVYKPLTQDDPLIRRPCLKLNKQILSNIEYTLIKNGIYNTIKFFLGKMI
jgi:nucleoside-diphosphate-sugar epimerase